MSLVDTVMDRLEQMVNRKTEEVAPFRAIVTGTSSGMVTIRRLEATTAETELRAVVYGYMPATNDEVICINVNGKPVVLGIGKRAAGPMIYKGSGSPESAVTAEVGSIYQRTNGSTATAVYIKESGSGNTGWVALGDTPDIPYPPDIRFMPFASGAVGTAPFAADGSARAYYLGNADKAYTSISVNLAVADTATGISWAELAICTSDALTAIDDDANLTTRGYTDVSTPLGSTGIKSIDITTSGIGIGDPLWLVFAYSASNTCFLNTIDESLGTSIRQTAAATARPSTWTPPQAFTVTTGSTTVARFYWWGS